MKRFLTHSGASNPYFSYTVPVNKVTNEMLPWCDEYPLNGDFERYYIQHSFYNDGAVFQFECEKPSFMFTLTFGHL